MALLDSLAYPNPIASEWIIAITWYDTWTTEEHFFQDHRHGMDALIGTLFSEFVVVVF